MIPPEWYTWLTWEHSKDLVLLGLFVWTHRSTAGKIEKNTTLTRKVGRAVDFGNDVTVAIARKGDSVPPEAEDESMRPRAITKTDEFEAILEEAAALDRKRRPPA